MSEIIVLSDSESGSPLAWISGIADRFHRGQVDKAGRPYIEHPGAVASIVKMLGGSLIQQGAAWLHDVVEDTDADLDTLRDLGVSEHVLSIVDAVTRRDGESYRDYLARVVSVPGATLVKRADIAHNTDPDRLAALDQCVRDRLVAKYERAVALLDRFELEKGGTDE